MKQPNVTAFSDYDTAGRWCLRIEKRRGKLTLEEIKAAARDHEWDFYLLVLDCFHEENDDLQFCEEPPKGDLATLYRTDLFYEEGEH